MRSLYRYLTEKKDGKNELALNRGDIMFTIWELPNKKVSWLNDNKSYMKIEYQFKEDDIEVDFLLGFKNESWKMWVGKIGACSYDDDPYCDFETDKFAEAIVKALDKCEDMIREIKDDPKNWVQFYKLK